MSSRNAFVLSPNSDGSVSFFVFVNDQWASAISPYQSITLGAWEHWAGSYDGTAIRLYKNGEVVAQTLVSGSVRAADRFCIGADCNTEATWRTDSCSSGITLQEYFYDAGIDDYNIRSIACSDNQICSDGACVNEGATAALHIFTLSTGETVETTLNLTHEETRQQFDSHGAYHYLTDIPVGHYTITATANGYETIVVHNVLVANRNNNEVKIHLKRLSSLITGYATIGSCTETDGGNNPTTKGTVTCGSEVFTDSCVTPIVVKEYFYDSDIDSYNYQQMTCVSGTSCSDGACRAAQSCTETDGGNNPTTKGTVTCGSEVFTDSCVTPIVVKEYFYDSDIDSYNYQQMTCVSGTSCSDGACRAATSPTDTGTCYESDNGSDFGTKGTIACKMFNRYFNGSADEIMMYGSALSPAEIRQLYATQVQSLTGEENVVSIGKYGVAPDAILYAFKVLDAGGYGTDRDVLAAIDRSLDPNADGDIADRLDILSISLGGYGNPDDVLSQAINRVVDAGVVAVIAAGNCGPGGSYYQCEFIGDYNTIASPGTSERAITVGAVNNRNKLALFSSRGPVVWVNGTLFKPDVLAPGVNVISTLPGNTYGAASGTSMATPHVTGVVALMKQVHPDWTPDDIKSALRSSSRDLSLSWHQQGFGSVQAPNAAFRDKDTFLVDAPRFGFGVATIEFELSSELQASSISLEYGSGLRPDNWTNVPIEEKDIQGARIIKDVSTFELDEGQIYTFRARSNLTEDRFIVVPDNLDTRDLPKPHVYAAQGLVPLSIGVHPSVLSREDISSYSLEYRSSETIDWNTEHLLSCNPVKGQEYKQAPRELCIDLGAREQRFFLNTSFINEAGFYDFQARLIYQDHEIIEGQNGLLFDPALRSGFPQPLSYGEVGSKYPGDFIPVVSDLVEDSEQEIIIYRGRYGYDPYTTVFVYRADGSLVWSTDVGRDLTAEMIGMSSFSVPVLGDIAGSARDEILVSITPIDPLTYNPTITRLYAINAAGYLVDGWPIDIPTSMAPRFVVADLDRDLENEIIVQSNGIFSSESEILSVIKGTEIVNQWNIPKSFSEGVYSPAVGNFDADSELEIVIAVAPLYNYDTSNATIIVYNADGSIVPGWPVVLPIALSNTHVPVVGDLNLDGKDDIIIGGVIYLGEGNDGLLLSDGLLYAIHGNGTLHQGYPQSLGSVKHEGYHSVAHYPVGSSALVNIDSTPDIEIATLTAGSYLDEYLVDLRHANGTSVAGWPQKVPFPAPIIEYGPTIADVSGDGVHDILVASGNSIIKSYYVEKDEIRPIRDGGVFAWHANGTLVAGFPKGTQYFAVAPPVVVDLEGDGKVELIETSTYDLDSTNNQPLGRGSLYVWDLASSVTSEESWNMYRRDSIHSACAECYPVADFEIESFSVSGENGGFEPQGTAILSKKYPVAILYNESMSVDELQSQSALLLRSLLFKQNLVKVLSEKLPLLNRRAQVVFWEVDFERPLVLYNGKPCTQPICTSILYNNTSGVLIVNVTNFSTFEIREAPICGDNVCQAELGESCSICASDCGVCPGGSPPPLGNNQQQVVRPGRGADFAPCRPQWQCTFGACVGRKQSKTCIDTRACNSTLNKPASETRACTAPTPGSRAERIIRPTIPGKDVSGDEDGFMSTWMWIVIAILILASMAAAIVVFVLRQRNPSLSVRARITPNRPY